MRDFKLFEDYLYPIDNWKITSFSADGFFCQEERMKLEEKYIEITEVTDKFNRQSVSYQLSKKDSIHRWLKYKEGFSADLVKILLNEFNIHAGATILDPFLGSGTTALVARLQGINSIGFDILPITNVSIAVKSSIFQYRLEELNNLIRDIENIAIPLEFTLKANYISITKDAYPDNREIELCFITDWNEKSTYSNEIKNLVTLCILNSLERISYSAKDGQYLRWDYRSPKIQDAEKKRLQAGKEPFATKLDKGVLPSLKECLLNELKTVSTDIKDIQKNIDSTLFEQTELEYINGSALYELPKKADNIINGVITSPPYCNRYDYTRTYALELVYLGKNEEEVKNLRQELLSCTVENKSKIERLKDHYALLGKENDYNKVISIIENNKTLKEINLALEARNKNGDINNKGVLKMVNGYFSELTFIYFELFRLCRKGAYVAFVNDNVRYGGEVIPVDYLSTELAEQIGFTPVKVYTLKQQKGNSSQQMKKFGRIPLRKSITIWKKN
ncbi:MAG TPA: modification methylase [Culturomica sp.]|nr:modification methylase [Culturomica sp.]